MAILPHQQNHNHHPSMATKKASWSKTRIILVFVVSIQMLVCLIISIFFMTAGPQEQRWASHKADAYLNTIVEGEKRLMRFAHLHFPGGEDPEVVERRRIADAKHRNSTAYRTLSSIKQGVHFTADFTVQPLADPVDEFDGGDPIEQLRDAGVKTLFKGEKVKPIYKYIGNSGNQSAKYPFVWLSKSPRIAYFPEFLTDDLCDRLVATANNSLQRSAVLPHNKGEKPVQDIRTSSQAWLSIYDGPGKELADKILDLSGFGPNDAEMLQILQYKVGQKYIAHHDYFDPKLYGKQPTLRAATVFLYLADVEEGGETWFPSSDGRPVLTGNYGSCKGGLKVRPKKRSAVLFYDLKASGALDPTSMHGGCPVVSGEKWGGTLWLRAKSVI